MTHDEWERGKTLTIHNATKAQLKFMVKDRGARIASLWKENEQYRKDFDRLAQLYGQACIQLKRQRGAGDAKTD